MKNFKKLVAVAMAFALTASTFAGVVYANSYLLKQATFVQVQVGNQFVDQMGKDREEWRQDIWATRPGKSTSRGANGNNVSYEFSKSPFYWTLYGSDTESVTLKSHHRPNSGYVVILAPGEYVWAPTINPETAKCPQGTVDCTFVSFPDVPYGLTPERCGFAGFTKKVDQTESSLFQRYLTARGYNQISWGVYRNNAGEYANIIPRDIVMQWAKDNGLTE